MSCEICDNMKKTGMEHVTEGGHFTFFMEYGQEGEPMLTILDDYGRIDDDEIRLPINNCPMCGEKLEKRS